MQSLEQSRSEHRTRGYTILRGLVPPLLIKELQDWADAALPLARASRGPQAQRLAPLGNFDLDLSLLHRYRDLTSLNDAIHCVLSPRHQIGDPARWAMLVEPAERPWCTWWHRDGRDHLTDMSYLAAWNERFTDTDLFNGMSMALYPDSCLWVVPGSHLREDTAEEKALFPVPHDCGPELDGKSAADREAECLRYLRSMPGAEAVHLGVGDLAIYRNCMWHTGDYSPKRRRATLHHGPGTPAGAEFASQFPHLKVAWNNEDRSLP